jgi:hypothetical protein
VNWLSQAVADFGLDCKAKVAGPDDRDDTIRAPVEALIRSAGQHLNLRAVPYDEVRHTSRAVRTDHAVAVNGAITGYLEVKRPGLSLDPVRLTGQNRTRWERQRDLPNLICTNGTEWQLWRYRDHVAGPVHMTGGPLARAGRSLVAPTEFESLVTRFLRWKPAPITSVLALVHAVAPLTRLLRGEVLDQLVVDRATAAEGAANQAQTFSGRARDLRELFFADASDEVFAGGYAQAVTFALLVAQGEKLELGGPLHQLGARLGSADQTLMRGALQLLTEDAAADFRVSLDLLVRVVGSVDWARIQAGRRDLYLNLYEHFLQVYDPVLPRQCDPRDAPVEVGDHLVPEQGKAAAE